MPTLTITKTYDDGQILNESDIDNIKSSVETFINTTKLDGDNLALDTITSAFTATQANNVAAAMTVTGSVSIINDLDSSHAIPTNAAVRILNRVDSTHAIVAGAANRIFNLADSVHSLSAGASNVVINQASSVHTIATGTANRIFDRVDSIHAIPTAAANKIFNQVDASHTISAAAANKVHEQSAIGGNDAPGGDTGDQALTGSFQSIGTATAPSTGTYFIVGVMELNFAASSIFEARLFNNTSGSAVGETYNLSTSVNESGRRSITLCTIASLTNNDDISIQARATSGSGFSNANDMAIVRIR